VIDVTAPPFNASPDVLPDTPVIGTQQKVIDALDAAGALARPGSPVRVVMPPGTFTMDLLGMPGTAAPGQKVACLWLKSNVILDLSRGTRIKLKAGAVRPAGSNRGDMVVTYLPTTGTTQNVQIWGGVIDGNADNQTLDVNSAPWLNAAISLARCLHGTIVRTRVERFKGTDSSPPGETFFFEAYQSRDLVFDHCIADNAGAIDTATFFGCNDSQEIVWDHCRAIKPQHGIGFTAWQSAHLDYLHCRVQATAHSAAFNIERCNSVRYTACVAGGNALHHEYGSATNPFITDDESYACASGWNVSGCRDVVGIACSGRNCTGIGLHIKENAPGFLPNPTGVGDITNGSNQLTNIKVPGGVGDITNGSNQVTNFVPTAGAPALANGDALNIVGGGIPIGTTIVAGAGTGTLTMSNVATTTAVGKSFFRAAFSKYLTVSGAGIPAGTTILDLVGTTATMSQNATATTGGVAITGVMNSDGVQFLGGDFRGSGPPVQIEANQLNVYAFIKDNTANDWYSEYGTSPVIRNNFGGSGLRRIGSAGASSVERWLSDNSQVIGGFDNGFQQFFSNGRRVAFQSKTADYTLARQTDEIVLAKAGVANLTLPTVANAPAGSVYTVINRSGGNINLKPQGASKIDNVSTNAAPLVVADGTKVSVVSDGTDYWTR
jgi:hypothetical protein